jgi:predicted Zn-dependent protease
MPGVGQLAGQLSQGVAAGYVANYSRDQELQADQLGAEYLARTHYDPKNMVDVIKVLQSQERYAAEAAQAEGRAAAPQSNWLSSHPSNDQRLAEIMQIAAQYTDVYGEDGRARYLKTVDGMAFGESSVQGLTRGQTFYHSNLGIALTAPRDWKIANTADAVMLVNPSNNAALVMSLAPPSAGTDHEQIIRALYNPTQGGVERYTLGTLPATHFVGTVTSAQGQARGMEVTIVSGPNNHHYVLTYAAKDAQSLAGARAGLRAAERSFRAITAADRAAVRPWSLRVVATPAGGLPELAAKSPLTHYAEQQLRLLNGYYGGGEPTPGEPIKIVQ